MIDRQTLTLIAVIAIILIALTCGIALIRVCQIICQRRQERAQAAALRRAWARFDWRQAINGLLAEGDKRKYR